MRFWCAFNSPIALFSLILNYIEYANAIIDRCALLYQGKQCA